MFPSSVLTKKICFVEKLYTTDEFGSPDDQIVEKEMITLWANRYVRPLGLNNTTEYSANPKEIVEWKMRYREDLIDKFQYAIRYNGNYYKIESIEELGEKEGIRISSTVTKFKDL